MRGFELIRGYDGKLPARGTPYSACVDFYACEGAEIGRASCRERV